MPPILAAAGAALYVVGWREAEACRAVCGAWACLGVGFLPMGLGLVGLASAAGIVGFAWIRRWVARRRDLAIDAELAMIDAELATINRRGS